MGFKILDLRHSAPGFNPERYQVRDAGEGTEEDAELARQKQLAIANRKREKQGKKPLDEDVLKIVRG